MWCPTCSPEWFERVKNGAKRHRANSEEQEQKTYATTSVPREDQLNAMFAAALISTVTPTEQQHEASDSSAYNGYQPQQGAYVSQHTQNGKEHEVGNFSQGQPHGPSKSLQQQYSWYGHPHGQPSQLSQGGGGGAFSQGLDYQQSQHLHQQLGNAGQHGSHASQTLGFQDRNLTQITGHPQGQPVGGFPGSSHAGGLFSYNHPMSTTSARGSTVDHQDGAPSSSHTISSALHRTPMDYPAKVSSKNPPLGSAPPRTTMDYPREASSYMHPKPSLPSKTAMDYPGNVPSSNLPQHSASSGWPSMNSLRKAIIGGIPKPQATQNTQPSSGAGGSTSAVDYPGAQSAPAPSHRLGLFGHSWRKPVTSMGPPSMPASVYRSTLSSSARHADKAAKRRNKK